MNSNIKRSTRMQTAILFALITALLCTFIPVAAKAAAPAPQGLALAEENGRISLSWQHEDGCIGYYIYRADSADGEYKQVGATTNKGSYNDRTIVAGQVYYYKISALKANGLMLQFTEQSAPVSNAPETTDPGDGEEMLAGLMVYAEGTNSAYLLWPEVEGADSYSIWRAQTENMNDEAAYAEIKVTADTIFADSDLSPSTSYYYTVYPMLEGVPMGMFAPMAVITGAEDEIIPTPIETPVVTPEPTPEPLPEPTPDPIPEPTPEPIPEPTPIIRELTVVPYSKNNYVGIDLSWEAVLGVKTYTVYQSTDGETFTRLGTTRNFKYTDNKLKGETEYFYKVVADNGATLYGQGITPQEQMEVSVSQYLGFDSIGLSISWTRVASANEYTVSRSLDGINFTELSTTNLRHIRDVGLEANTAYYYKVTADSGAEAIGKGTTAAQQKLVALATPNWFSRSITLRWNSINDAESYTIYRASGLFGNYEHLVTTGSTSWVDESVNSFRIYYYKIVADNGATGYTGGLSF